MNTWWSICLQKLIFAIILLIVATLVSPDVMNIPSTLILVNCSIIYWFTCKVMLTHYSRVGTLRTSSFGQPLLITHITFATCFKLDLL